MIKTKFWIFCVLVLLLVGVNLVHTAQGRDADVRSGADARLAWAEGRLAELQAAEHRAPLEAAIAAASLDRVRSLLSRAHQDAAAPDPVAFEEAVEALGEAAARGEAPHQLLIVATAHGASRFVAGEAAEHDLPTPDVSALRAALEGTARAGLTTVNGTLLQVAAVPVSGGDEVLGAVLLGYPIDGAFASRLRDALGIDVTLLVGGQVAVSSLPADGRGDLAQAAGRAAPGRAFGYGSHGGTFLGITGALTGVEPALGLARVVPLAGVEDGLAALSVSTAEAYDWLEDYQMIQVVLGGGLLVLGLLWGFFVGISATGPVKTLTTQLSKAANGDLGARVDPKKFGGPFRRLAEVVNGVLEKAESKSPAVPGAIGRKKEQDISSLLPDSPPPPEEPSPDAFDFGGFGGPSDGPAPLADPPAEPEPQPAAFEPPPAPEPEPDPAAFDPFSAESSPLPPAPEPAPEAFESPPAPAAADDDDSDSTRVVSLDAMQAAAQASEADGGLGDAGFGDASAQAQAASSLAGGPDDPFAAAYSEPGDFGDEDDSPDATVVAKVPDALLQATARGGGAKPADPDEAHFKEVFRDFVATRQKCGEPADGLTYEKFAVKLRKNRDTIKDKHGARGVRFQVYVKDGKAALKATPIK